MFLLWRVVLTENSLAFQWAVPGGLIIVQPTATGTLHSRQVIGRLILNSTARTNRVHLHPSGAFALLALEQGYNAPGDSLGGLAIASIKPPTAPTLLTRVGSPRPGHVYCASWSPSGRYLVSFSAQNRSAFVYEFVVQQQQSAAGSSNRTPNEAKAKSDDAAGVPAAF